MADRKKRDYRSFAYYLTHFVVLKTNKENTKEYHNSHLNINNNFNVKQKSN